MVRPSTQPSSRRRATKAAAHGAKPEALAPRNPIVGSLPVCCARATSGHAAAAPRNGMNSRRLIGPPVQERASYPLKLEQWKRPNLPVKPQSRYGRAECIGGIQEEISIDKDFKFAAAQRL